MLEFNMLEFRFNKKKINLSLFLVGVLSSFFLCSCDPQDPPPANEEELITSLIYTLVSVNTKDTVVFSFRDLDGDGGASPVIVNGKLKQNTNYSGTVLLLNESKSPVVDINSEILNEATEHQFFYQAASVDCHFAYTDSDSNGNPIGIQTLLQARAASKGKMTITLRHLPNKFGNNVVNGDITNAAGETDIEISFDVQIE